MTAGLNVPLTPLRFLDRSATIHPDRTACVDGPRRVTFAGMREDALRLARALQRRGLRPGGRVGMLASNSYEALLAQFAVPLAGGVLVPINTRLAPAEVRYICDHAGIGTLFGEQELILACRRTLGSAGLVDTFVLIQDADGTQPTPKFPDSGVVTTFDEYLAEGAEGAELPFTVGDEDAAIAINYTSGTTGRPKGVVYTHRGAYLAALGMVMTHNYTRDSVYLWTLPMFHCSGWCTGWAAMAACATQVALRAVRGPEVWRLIDEEGVTGLCGAPAVLATIVSAEEAHQVTDLSVATAGAPPSPTVIGACEDLGIDVIHVYGLTETYGPTVTCAPQPDWATLSTAERARLKSRQGLAMVTSEEVRVVEQIGKDAPPDVTLVDVPSDGETMGEVVMRGNIVMREYFHNPDATEEAFRGGWFHSGDLAVKHPDGYIQVLDRAKDVVISGGENISTIEVEQAVISHPSVADVSVIGVPDDRWGEALRAYVVLVPGVEQDAALESSVIDHCRGLIAGYKVPRDYRVIDELPRTSTGKVRKNMLREQAD
ncbi:MAG: AMP-binding protein [Corynebacterium sp.]|uniref:AMP-binding protein n=1 Tax=unclassified Corynebacterium TaxID=2624378 RepID=UPI002648F8B8|nr:AMP-binding protein [Corynebacterium sp.]MDN5581142.1 AMP-binding protein [Corynebacterium sp.]MDN5719443.1 AMP-binding protein [Corynebacterium sp.]